MKATPESPDTEPGQRLDASREAVMRQVDALYQRRPRTPAGEAEALTVLGSLCISAGLHERAVELLVECLAIDPSLVKAHIAIGQTYGALEKYPEAIAAFRRVLELSPASAEAHAGLGSIFNAQGAVEEAISSYREAVALKPDFAEAWHQIGVLHHSRGELDDAIACYRRAYGIAPDHARAKFSEALALLLKGNLKAGWMGFENRWLTPPLVPRRKFNQPMWLGQFSIAGKTILLHAEQGLGDTLQFVRYARRVAGLGANVLLEVQPQLKTLLEGLPSIAAVFGVGEALPDFDVHCPLGSLPLAFGTDLQSIPAEVPYLRAQPAKSVRWKARLAGQPGLRVGVVWAGHRQHPRDRERSMPLRLMLGLLEEPGWRFFSLQKDLAEKEAELVASLPGISNLAQELHDFSDTAAVVENLDCVVSVDTAVAHLAGALGKPVFVMLPVVPDWRWLLHREDSPWYPTARLVRQQKPGDWAAVVEEVRGRLRRIRESNCLD